MLIEIEFSKVNLTGIESTIVTVLKSTHNHPSSLSLSLSFSPFKKKKGKRVGRLLFHTDKTDTSMGCLTFANFCCCTQIYPHLSIGLRSNPSSLKINWGHVIQSTISLLWGEIASLFSLLKFNQRNHFRKSKISFEIGQPVDQTNEYQFKNQTI